MLTFLQFITEAVKKTDLIALRKEAQMFSKNIRRIQNGKDLYTVAQAYVKWTAMMEIRIYHQLLGQLSGAKPGEHGRPEEGWRTDELRKGMWALVSDRNVLTPKIHNYDGDKLYTKFTGEGYPVYHYDDRTKADWDAMYQTFDKGRNSIYAKYTKYVRDAFDSLEQWLEDKPDELTSHYEATIIPHDGVTVKIMKSDDTGSKYDSEIKMYLKSLSFVLHRYRKMGYGHIVDKLQYVYDLADGQASAAGTYDAGRINSFLLQGNETHTIAHEIGHHLWRFLKKSQQKDWTDFIVHNRVTFSDQDYAHIKAVYDHVVGHLGAQERTFSHIIEGVWENITHLLTDPATKEMYQSYCRQNPIRMSVWAKDPEKSFQDFKDETRHGFAMDVPTAYSNKNTEEAWCEVVSYFVIGRPLQPLIAHQLKVITGWHDIE